MVNETCERGAVDQAVTELKKPRGHPTHLLVNVLVCAFQVVIWPVSGVRESSGQHSRAPAWAW